LISTKWQLYAKLFLRSNSEIKAKLEFPEPFTPALDIDSHHLTSEQEAARSEAEIIEEITLNYGREESGADTEPASDDRKDGFNEQPLKCNQEMDPKPTSARKPIPPSFYPS
jgi:hypothetical protein